jgi:hypothetical protein
MSLLIKIVRSTLSTHFSTFLVLGPEFIRGD